MKCPKCTKKIDYFNQLILGNKITKCEHCGARIKLKSENQFVKAFVIFFVVIAIAGALIDDVVILSILLIIILVVIFKTLFVLEIDEKDDE